MLIVAPFLLALELRAPTCDFGCLILGVDTLPSKAQTIETRKLHQSSHSSSFLSKCKHKMFKVRYQCTQPNGEIFMTNQRMLESPMAWGLHSNKNPQHFQVTYLRKSTAYQKSPSACCGCFIWDPSTKYCGPLQKNKALKLRAQLSSVKWT